MRKRTKCFGWFGPFVVLCFAMLNSAGGQEKGERPELVIPKLEPSPVADGVMTEGEWDRASVVTGFVGPTGKYGRVMMPKGARIYLGHDDERIFVGVWMELAPGETPSMQRRRRDSQVFMDRHQFELWLTPPTDGHTTAYQIIGNAYGALYDIQHVPSLGIQNLSWDGDIEFENEYETGEYWTAELSIPIDELADPDHYNPEKPWGVMLGTAWPQRSWPYTHGWYSNIETHARARLGESSTGVRLNDLSSLFDNHFEPDLELVSGEEEDETFSVEARRGDMSVEEQVVVPAGEIAKVDISRELPEAEDKVNLLEIRVKGPEEQVLIDGQWGYRPIPPEERELEEVDEKPWKMSVDLSYAPLNMGARALVDVLDAPMRDELKEAVFRVLDENEEVVPVNTAFEKGVKAVRDDEFRQDEAEAYLWLPEDLPYGKYILRAELLDDEGNVLDSAAEHFEHKDHAEDFVWLNSEQHQYGTDLTANAPYEPLEIDENTFRIWGRRYAMNGALPSRMSSQKEELLSRPLSFVAQIDGQPHVAKIAEPFAVLAGDENQARFTGAYEVGGLTLELEGKILFDGGIVYELEAIPGEDAQSVERLYLSVPVRKEVAEYMWTTPGGMSGISYLLNDLPEEGIIWSSDEVREFVPYVGLSDDERAIQWFADHDHDWIRGEDVPSVQAVRSDGEVELQVNFIRRASEGEPFKAEFGLIATPIKPLPEDWRNTILHNRNLTDTDNAFFYGPGHGKVGPFHWHDDAGLAAANAIEIPEGKSAQEHLAEMSGEGYPDLEAIEENLGADVPGKVRNGLRTYEDPSAVRNCYFHNARMYFEGNNSKAFSNFFKGDWAEIPRAGWFHLRPVKSYQDFFLFHLNQFAKFWHVPGIYYDETYYGPDYNVFNEQGKLLPDGSIRPSFSLLLQRQFLYRTRQVLLDQGLEPFMWVHTSEQMAPFSIGAAVIAMFGENNTPTPQQDIMDNIGERYMRSIGRAQKFGFVPVWMTMAGRGGSNWALPGRQTFGWCWLHDTIPEVHTHVRAWPTVRYRKQWGIGGNKVEFQGYWQDGGYVEADDSEYRASYWTRPDPEATGRKKVLLMVMNMHYPEDDDSTVEITIDPEKLNLPDDWKVYNLETMPDYVKRENVLDRLDRETNRGFGEVEEGPQEILGRDLLFWGGDRKYELDKLQIVSDGDESFRISVPGRDFLTVIIE